MTDTDDTCANVEAAHNEISTRPPDAVLQQLVDNGRQMVAEYGVSVELPIYAMALVTLAEEVLELRRARAAEQDARCARSESYNFAEAVNAAQQLTPQQVLDISINAGIHNPDGTLTEKYQESKK